MAIFKKSNSAKSLIERDKDVLKSMVAELELLEVPAQWAEVALAYCDTVDDAVEFLMRHVDDMDEIVRRFEANEEQLFQKSPEGKALLSESGATNSPTDTLTHPSTPNDAHQPKQSNSTWTKFKSAFSFSSKKDRVDRLEERNAETIGSPEPTTPKVDDINTPNLGAPSPPVLAPVFGAEVTTNGDVEHQPETPTGPRETDEPKTPTVLPPVADEGPAFEPNHPVLTEREECELCSPLRYAIETFFMPASMPNNADGTEKRFSLVHRGFGGAEHSGWKMYWGHCALTESAATAHEKQIELPEDIVAEKEAQNTEVEDEEGDGAIKGDSEWGDAEGTDDSSVEGESDNNKSILNVAELMEMQSKKMEKTADEDEEVIVSGVASYRDDETVSSEQRKRRSLSQSMPQGSDEALVTESYEKRETVMKELRTNLADRPSSAAEQVDPKRDKKADEVQMSNRASVETANVMGSPSENQVQAQQVVPLPLSPVPEDTPPPTAPLSEASAPPLSEAETGSTVATNGDQQQQPHHHHHHPHVKVGRSGSFDHAAEQKAAEKDQDDASSCSSSSSEESIPEPHHLEVLNRKHARITADEACFPGRRARLEHDVEEYLVGKQKAFKALQHLRQTRLDPTSKTPQGKRDDRFDCGDFVDVEHAARACVVMAPPVWEIDGAPCYLCNRESSGMLAKTHHCRNCGRTVCSTCSAKRWPSSMIPETFHDNEKNVRVCDCCHSIAVTFSATLIAGDFNMAMALFATGNINQNCMLDLYGTQSAYPVHFAAMSGNVVLLHWLIEECDCLLYDPHTDAARTTREGNSVLAVAALYGHSDMVKYLIMDCGMDVRDICDPKILQMHLHLTTDGTPSKLPPDLQPRTRKTCIPRLSRVDRMLSTHATEYLNRGLHPIIEALLKKQENEHLVQWVPKNICYDGVLEIFWKTDFRYSLPFKVDPVESTTNIPLDSPQKRQSIPAAPTIKFHGPDVIKTVKSVKSGS